MLYKSTNLGVRQTAAYRVGLLNIRVDAKQTLSQSLAGEDSISISEYYLFTVYFSGMHSILRSTSVSILVSSRLHSVLWIQISVLVQPMPMSMPVVSRWVARPEIILYHILSILYSVHSSVVLSRPLLP